jgi:hypothetical protein
MEGYDHDAEERYWYAHDAAIERRIEEFGPHDDDDDDDDESDDQPTSKPTSGGPNLTLMANREDVLEPLVYECEKQIADAIKLRDVGLIGTIVLAAHDSFCNRVHYRARGASDEQLAQMPTERQAAALAIIKYLTGKK